MIDSVLIAVIVVVGLALSYYGLTFLISFPALIRERQYIRSLEPVSPDVGETAPEFLQERRDIALSMGFRFVNTYRAMANRAHDLMIDLWLSHDCTIIGMVRFRHVFRIPYGLTAFYSAAPDGARLTTQDNFDEGDLMRLRGTEVFLDEEFGPLFRRHQSRIEQLGRGTRKFVFENVLSALEELERVRVETLVSRGWARYRNNDRNVWSYTFRGAAEVYFKERLRFIQDHKDKMRRESAQSAS